MNGSTDTADATDPTRREVLRYGSASAIAAGAALLPGCGGGNGQAAQAPHAVTDRRRTSRPANVIMLVSDGMSLGVPTLAEPFSRRVRNGRGTTWARLLASGKPTHSLLHTASANSMVTDSAAAASAWGSGERCNNGSLNVTPDGRSHRALAERLVDRGHRCAVVTTDRATGATPSGFAVQSADRNAYERIAPQFLDRCDIVLGGARAHFDPASRTDRRDLLAEYRAAGYRVCTDKAALSAAAGERRVLGLFADGTLPYTIDHRRDAELRRAVPTLAEMTDAALRSLAAGDQRFFIMIEAARVDHAAHANDAAGMLWDQLAFDDAVAVAVAFARRHPDTLVVVTSDHGNANPGLNGMGAGYADTDDHFANLARSDASFEWLAQAVRRRAATGEDPADVLVELVDRHMDATLDADVAAQVGPAIVGETEVRFDHELAVQQRNWYAALGQVLANVTGVAFTGVSHTADHVLLTAAGPGAEAFAGLRHHRDVHGYLAETFAARAAHAGA